ncbi:hypothetical protein F4780DRAFT_789126 [Xylariomycetidae sp. FL0641]|nr:hypothetical protein F4780DRAFT_789126 [Xylariomycetidae sp. FL0641]
MADSLLMGVDIGVSQSGISYVPMRRAETTGTPEARITEIRVIANWESDVTNYSTDEKVPTRIHYREDGGIDWGRRVPADVEPLQWFKLLLLKTRDLPDELKSNRVLERTRQRMVQMEKGIEDVMADFIRLLCESAIKQLHKHRKVPEDIPIQYCFTVPAIWPGYAREAMLSAAKRAVGQDKRISLMTEPEAAAVDLMHRETNRGDFPIQIAGDILIVLDVGGGTADAIPYKVKQAAIHGLDPLMEECGPGQGALAGAVRVDTAFEQLLIQKVGIHEWNRLTTSQKSTPLRFGWDICIKRSFQGSQYPSAFEIDLGLLGTHYLSANDIRRCFDTVQPDINALVQAQIDAVMPEKDEDAQVRLLLVGGFGQSPYLFQFLEDKFENKGLEVVQPQNGYAWSAISRGAVLATATGTRCIDSRIARRSYGILYRPRWDPGRHAEADRWWDRTRGEWMTAHEEIDWVIKKGQKIDLCTEVSKKFEMVLTKNKALGSRPVYTCGRSNPPPIRADDDTVEEHARIKLRLPSRVKRLLKNKKRYNFKYEWRFGVNGEVLEAQAYWDGEADVPIGEVEFADA